MFTQSSTSSSTTYNQDEVNVSDIDGCLIIRKKIGDKTFYGINKMLIDEWKNRGVKRVCLMSNFDLSDIDHLANMISTRAEDRNNLNYIARLHLIPYCQQQGMSVTVTTQADPVYEKGIGLEQGAYHNFYMAAYHAYQTDPKAYPDYKRSPDSPNAKYTNLTNQIKGLADYDTVLQKNKKIAEEVNKQIIHKAYDERAASQKHFMFHYLIKNISESNSNITTIEYTEDDPICIQAIAAICETHLPYVKLKINHIREKGTPALSFSNPNIEYRCIEQSDIPLYIPNTKEYEAIVDLVKENNQNNEYKLFPAHISSEQLAELVKKEISYIDMLSEFFPTFKEAFARAFSSSYPDTTWDNEKQNAENNHAKTRRMILTVLSNMSEDNKILLNKKFEANQKGFNGSSTDQDVFSYFPQLITSWLPSQSWELNPIACKFVRELDKFVDAQRLANIRDFINNRGKPGLFRSSENKIAEGYKGIILEMAPLLAAHRYENMRANVSAVFN